MMTPFEKLVCDPGNHAGFTREVLVQNGVPWPAPKGWRRAVKARVMARAARAGRRPSAVEAMIVGYLAHGV